MSYCGLLRARQLTACQACSHLPLPVHPPFLLPLISSSLPFIPYLPCFMADPIAAKLRKGKEREAPQPEDFFNKLIQLQRNKTGCVLGVFKSFTFDKLIVTLTIVLLAQGIEKRQSDLPSVLRHPHNKPFRPPVVRSRLLLK